MSLRRLFVLTAASAALGLVACGGGGSSPPPPPAAPAPAPLPPNPAALTITDNTIGTGAQAVAGLTATVRYTGWLYTNTAADFKGAQFDTGSFSFRLGSGQVIPGFDQGVTGMRVGGTRTILIPSNLGYGAQGVTGIPPNSGLVFTVTLNALQ